MHGYNAVPSSIYDQISGSSSDTFRIGRIRKYSREAIADGRLAHLGVTWADDGLAVTSGSVIPPPERGRWSKYNVNGRQIIRKDLPMVTKIVGSWTTPNFGDWSKGSHTHSNVRKVYQRETLYGRGLPINVTAQNPTAETAHIAFVVDRVFDRKDLDKNDLLLACSLLRENTGLQPGIIPSDVTVAEWVNQQSVSWELLPVGELGPDPFGKNGEATRRLNLDADDPRVLRAAERFNKVNALSPPQIILGEGGFTRYIGFMFRNDLVALECLTYGNALYLMYQDWSALSQRSRIDLLADTTADYDRVIHRDGWEGRLAGLLRAHGHGTDGQA